MRYNTSERIKLMDLFAGALKEHNEREEVRAMSVLPTQRNRMLPVAITTVEVVTVEGLPKVGVKLEITRCYMVWYGEGGGMEYGYTNDPDVRVIKLPLIA